MSCPVGADVRNLKQLASTAFLRVKSSMRIESLLSEITLDLLSAGISNARQEACWLVSQLLGDDPIRVPCCGGAEFPSALEVTLRKRVSRRKSGEPLQYIMGEVEFHCVNLLIGPGVLIPRPETEQLVELALSRLTLDGPIVDLCTGSGAIALALSASRPARTIFGTDISEDALSWAFRNRDRLKASNVTFLQGDLFQPLPADLHFALVTANPPYVSQDEYNKLDPTVKDHEPITALLAKDNGLQIIRDIARQAKPRLLPDGWLVMEIGETQGEKVRQILLDENYTLIDIKKDYSGRDRFALAKR
jgi:release factor glutamine methyltransferase